MSEYIKITRKEPIEIAKNKGIKQPHKMSIKDLVDSIDRQ